jgi:hypothetical protein
MPATAYAGADHCIRSTLDPLGRSAGLEGSMAIVILGGAVASAALNLLPSLIPHFGRFDAQDRSA